MSCQILKLQDTACRIIKFEDFNCRKLKLILHVLLKIVLNEYSRSVCQKLKIQDLA